MLRRPRLALSVISALALGGVPAAAHAAAPWHHWRDQGAGVFRTGAYVRGEFIYTNGLFQARGANTDGKHRPDYFTHPGPIDPGFMQRDLYLARTYDFFGSHRQAHNGDYHLPQDTRRWPAGTADLAQLRLAVERGYLYVRFVWNSMPRRDAQIATLTFARRGSEPSAAGWPHNARLSSRWWAALTTWGSGGALARRGSAERRIAVRTGSHVTEARIPLRLLPRGPWTLTGGSGLTDPAAPSRYWNVPTGDATGEAPGSGGPSSPTNVWDLLFAPDHPWTFDELHQADDLAAGSAATDTQTVEPALLRRHANRPPPPQTGTFSRLFTSTLFVKDGIRVEGGAAGTPSSPPGFTPGEGFNQTWLYTGRRQWYGMHVPTRYSGSRRAWPLIVYLHGFTGLPEEAFHNPVGLIDAADRNGYIVATPLGRGDYFYKGDGDFDVLEVIRDVERHYHIDRDRIYLMGHSMGGYGTNNVSMHHPDLFAAVAPAQGTESIDLHRNLRNVPWFEMSSEQDLDAHAQNARKLYGLLSGDGYDATLLVYQMKIHEYSSIYDTLPRLFRFFAAHRRVRNPAIVSWTRPTDPERRRLGQTFDGAYWVRGVRAAGSGTLATVTLISDAIRHRIDDPAAAHKSDTMVDEHGPTGRSKGELTQTIPAVTPFAPLRNALSIEATGAAALSADLRRARLRIGRSALRITVSTDHSLALTLDRISPGAVLVGTGGGRRRVLVVRHGRVMLHIPAGRHEIAVSRSSVRRKSV